MIFCINIAQSRWIKPSKNPKTKQNKKSKTSILSVGNLSELAEVSSALVKDGKSPEQISLRLAKKFSLDIFKQFYEPPAKKNEIKQLILPPTPKLVFFKTAVITIYRNEQIALLNALVSIIFTNFLNVAN